MLAEVDELLDETLTEIGTMPVQSNRLDSVEYAAEVDRRLKQRDQELASGTNVEFQAVSTKTDGDMFKHLDRIRTGASTKPEG